MVTSGVPPVAIAIFLSGILNPPCRSSTLTHLEAQTGGVLNLPYTALAGSDPRLGSSQNPPIRHGRRCDSAARLLVRLPADLPAGWDESRALAWGRENGAAEMPQLGKN